MKKCEWPQLIIIFFQNHRTITRVGSSILVRWRSEKWFGLECLYTLVALILYYSELKKIPSEGILNCYASSFVVDLLGLIGGCTSLAVGLHVCGYVS